MHRPVDPVPRRAHRRPRPAEPHRAVGDPRRAPRRRPDDPPHHALHGGGRPALRPRSRSSTTASMLALDTPAELKRSVGADTIVTVTADGDLDALADAARRPRSPGAHATPTSSTAPCVLERARRRRACCPRVVARRRAQRLRGHRPLGHRAHARDRLHQPHREGPPRMTTATIPDAPTTLAPAPQAGRRGAARRVPRAARCATSSCCARTSRSSSPARSSSRSCWCSCSPTCSRRSARASAAAAARREFSTLLVAGVVGLAIMFQGIQSVALPLVQEFGYTRRSRTACSRRCRCRLVAIEKIVAGALQWPVRGAARVPDRGDRAGHAGAPRTSTGRCCSRSRRSPAACAARSGSTFGTRFEPRTVPLLFGIIVLPLTFLGCIYYPWSSLEPIRWLQIARAREPARVHVRGLPGRAHRRRRT